MAVTNPYANKPDYQFWPRSVSGRDENGVDPIIGASFKIGKSDRIATAGSCFAQHIARKLQSSGYHYFVPEAAPASAAASNENFGVFSARYGNIYTVRQLLQLFQRVYGLFTPADIAWQRKDGRFIDPFRPQIQERGFASQAEVVADRKAHFEAVREIFESSDIFVFTLGLTEGWESTRDNAVFPLAPGVAGVEQAEARFHNFRVAEIEDDLRKFVRYLMIINPSCRIILTVSPVPLIATYEAKHALVANTYSKSVLRVAAETISGEFAEVEYFPAFEIVTGQQAGNAFYSEDRREVRPEGVARVMSIFSKHYLREASERTSYEERPSAELAQKITQRQEALQTIICDEEAIEASW